MLTKTQFNLTLTVYVCFVFQVGEEEPQEEMLMMCDDPSSQHFYKVDNYNELLALKDRLLESLCDGKPHCLSSHTYMELSMFSFVFPYRMPFLHEHIVKMMWFISNTIEHACSSIY